MRGRKIGRAPDYTTAALVMLGVNLVWVFWALWALWGFLATLIFALLLNHGISRLAGRAG